MTRVVAVNSATKSTRHALPIDPVSINTPRVFTWKPPLHKGSKRNEPVGEGHDGAKVRTRRKKERERADKASLHKESSLHSPISLFDSSPLLQCRTRTIQETPFSPNQSLDGRRGIVRESDKQRYILKQPATAATASGVLWGGCFWRPLELLSHDWWHRANAGTGNSLQCGSPEANGFGPSRRN